MTPEELKDHIKNVTLQELVDTCIWQSVMEGTAWCGWTDRAREGLIKSVQENVRWAIEQKLGDQTKMPCPDKDIDPLG